MTGTPIVKTDWFAEVIIVRTNLVLIKPMTVVTWTPIVKTDWFAEVITVRTNLVLIKPMTVANQVHKCIYI